MKKAMLYLKGAAIIAAGAGVWALMVAVGAVASALAPFASKGRKL